MSASILLSSFDRRVEIGANQADHLQGTLDMLILKAIGDVDFHELGIACRVEQITGGVLAR